MTMMLRFILGRSGTGKTAAIHNRIRELVEGGEEQVLMLVPDQSSFETEKAFLDTLGARLCKRVEVFGFDGMCRHVFAKTRFVPLNVIDDGTRAVLMSIALEQLSEKLTLLPARRSRAVGDMLLATLAECKKNGITTAMLRVAAENIADETLKIKLTETALVLDAFDALLSQSYVDPLDNLERLKNILLENQTIFQNRVLFIDLFSGFTKVQLDIIRILLTRCREVNIALTLDPEGRLNDEVFQITHATCDGLSDMAKREFVDIKTPVRKTEPLRFQNDDLIRLEEGIFRRRFTSYEEEPRAITVYSAADLYDECEFVARRIKRLVMEQGFRYRDISVICRDSKPYRGILDVMLEKYDIPYFTDSHQDVNVKPAARLLNSIFRLVTEGFAREDFLSLLKTGLTDISEKEISALENYLYIWNISGRRLCEPFTLNPRGYADEFTDADREALAKVEGVRRRVAEPLLAFRADCKGKTGREISERLWQLLVELDAPDALSAMYDTLERSEKGLGAEQVRVWSLLTDALDKIVAAVGEIPLSPERYYELLTIQISNIEFSRIPQTLDCVEVTTVQRVRNTSQQAAFLIGCCDGEFPAVPHATGLFSDYEIKQLLLNDITISDDFAYIGNLETYMAYCAMTAPSELLYVSYPCMSMEGEKKKPSSIVSEVLKIFPNLRVTDRFDYDGRSDAMLALTPAFEEYARSLSGDMAELKGLGAFFRDNPRYAAGADAVRRALDRSPFRIEQPENARLLFGEQLTVSASQVEKFSKCRFAYFCTYGLRVRERLKAEINPMEYGTMVHYILERFFKDYSKEEYAAMTDGQLSAFIRSTVDAYLEGYLGGGESKEKSFLYRLDVLCGNLLLLLRHLIDELRQSDFEVADCELNIGRDIPAYTVKLPTGENIAVCGSVDRVDVMHTDGGDYLRIIDYKTGAKTFKLSDILFGLNMQMLLYLCAIERGGGARYGEFTPAGILYMPAVVPNIAADGLDEEAIQRKINDDFKMNGLLLDDVRVIKGMDKTENAKYIPVKIKNGSSPASDSLATLARFGQIFQKLNDTVAQMGERLYGGDVAAAPLKGGTDACEYCPYDSVCVYRRSDPVRVYGMKNDEVYQKLEEEQKGGDAPCQENGQNNS